MRQSSASIGHVALRLRSLAVPQPFNTSVLGLREVGCLDEAAQAAPADPDCAGLVHVALRIGDDIETLHSVHVRLRALGVPLHHARDHEVSQSPYLQDPNEVDWLD